MKSSPTGWPHETGQWSLHLESGEVIKGAIFSGWRLWPWIPIERVISTLKNILQDACQNRNYIKVTRNELSHVHPFYDIAFVGVNCADIEDNLEKLKRLMQIGKNDPSILETLMQDL